MKKSIIASLLLSTSFVLTGCQVQSKVSLDTEPTDPMDIVIAESEEIGEVQPQEIAQSIVEEPKQEEVKPKYKYKCPGCSSNEIRTLEFLQDQGIEDKTALATIMGNIKQESMFITNICEGGARIPYENCHRGGYGLIQWTTSYRYWGLGNTAKKMGKSATDIDVQLSWMVQEREWKEAVQRFKRPGQSIQYYMRGAYIWLGWGIHGNRTKYSYQYLNYIVPTA